MTRTLHTDKIKLEKYALVLRSLQHDLSDAAAKSNESVKLNITDLKELDYHGITALICHRQLPSHVRISDELKSTLKKRTPLMVANESLRNRELEVLFSALDRAKLTNFIVFKGGALAHTIYEHSWDRARTDTDILIDQAELTLFSAVVEKLGYSRLFAIKGNYVSYQCTFGKNLIGSATINIDVHWRISNRQTLANAYSLADLTLEGQQLTNFLTNPIIPSFVDSLLIACLHRLGHHHTEERLTWLYDIHLLSAKLNPEDWKVFVRKAQLKQLTSISLNALDTAISYFSTSIPHQVLEELNINAAKYEPSRIFLNRKASALSLFISDVKAVKGLNGKLGFIFETFFPSPDYVRKKMRTKSTVKAYGLRATQGIKRWFSTH
ncbi:hypothetical protein NBRC116583_21880 [Arenicella sp. 4NH20-0111]|uniref:nucleotidyltransferase family protein n=1 Tax=Arenicella sp. 4NH20-0111 TaxID=3127648 RepID=UPI0031059C6C